MDIFHSKRTYMFMIALFGAPQCLLFADQVTLKNGDSITGTIMKKDGDKLTIKSEFLGEVTMPWAAVTSIRSDTPLFVSLPSGGDVSGKVNTQGGNLVVETPARQESTPLGSVPAIRGGEEQQKFEKLLSPNWLQLWGGYFDLGFSLARGNARTDTLSSAFNLSRVTRNDKTTLYFNQIYSTATVNRVNSATAQAIRGGVSYDHNLSPRVFLNAFNDYEYDRFQDLDLRFVVGGGAGFHAVKNERTVLDLLAGADYSRSNFTGNILRNAAEAYWGDDLAYKVSGVTSLTQSFRMFNNLSSTGDYRVNFDAGTVTTIKRRFSWQVTASDRLLSNPVFGRQRNEFLLTTGLRINFAQ